MAFQINTKKHFKIWFSKDEDVFLDVENRHRFIHMRVFNPTAQLTFVYNSLCISERSRQNLLSFCEKNRILPLDFHTEIPKILEHPLDWALNELARLEIKHTINNSGGNFAAASDLVRLLIPVLEQRGIYSDFDAGVYLNYKPEIMDVKTSVLLPIRSTDTEFVSPNNEMIIAAFDPADPTKLHQDAITRIRRVQQEIIKRYDNPRYAFYESPIQNMPTGLGNYPLLYWICGLYFRVNPADNIFNFRQFSLQVTIDGFQLLFNELLPSEQEGMLRKYTYLKIEVTQGQPIVLSDKILQMIYELEMERLYVFSVISFSGPISLYALYNDIEYAQPSSSTADTGHDDMMKKFMQCSFAKNDLSSCLLSGNVIKDQLEKGHRLGRINDLSWYKSGAEEKTKRIQELHQSATTIKQAWRRWCLFHTPKRYMAGSSNDSRPNSAPALP